MFKRLNESTVRGWFVQGSYTDLTKGTLDALKRGAAFYKPVSSGKNKCLENFPHITKELVDTLKSLRDAGMLLLGCVAVVFCVICVVVCRYTAEPGECPSNHERYSFRAPSGHIA